MKKVINLILIVIVNLKLINAKYEEGEITTNEPWIFVSRFCFLSDDGEFEYSIQYDRDYGDLSLLLYYDSDHQWPAVYKSEKTCREKEGVLDIRLNQLIKLVPSNIASGCIQVKSNRSKILTCHHKSRFRSARERWWFLALSNCNTTKGLKFRYKFLMTNGLPGDYWHEHFSADEFYILPVLLGFFIIYMLLVIAVILCASELRSRQLLHSTYKLFAFSVYLQEMGILTQALAYLRYAVDGIGSPVVKTMGKMTEAGSEATFLLLLLLMAKGYTITRGRLRVSSAIKITIFMCLYTVTYVTLFIYEQMFFDPGEVLYTYESPAGYGLIVLRIIAWWMFIYFTVFTLKHYPEKTSFYYPFNLVGTMWFVAGPTFILAANTMVDKWVRESVVYFVLHLIALLGHLLFLLLTVPSRANKNFPYHVRTTQIGIMEITDGIAGNNSLDAFGHHPYAPGGPSSPWPRVPVGLFTIAQSNCSVSTNGNSMMVRRQSMAVRRIFTPESLVLRHEEILPNANFMACMVRTEIQASNRLDPPVPFRAITRGERKHSDDRLRNGRLSIGNAVLPNGNTSRIRESDDDEDYDQVPSGNDLSDPVENQNNTDDKIHSSKSFSNEEDLQSNDLEPQEVTSTSKPNPFIVTTTNKVVEENTNDAKNIDTIFKVAESSNAVENGDVNEYEDDKNYNINENLTKSVESDNDDELETSFTNKIYSNQPLSSFTKRFYDQNTVSSHNGETHSVASFPRDDEIRSSIRKLPPLKLNDESKSKIESNLNETQINGVHQKPILNRSESRVQFNL